MSTIERIMKKLGLKLKIVQLTLIKYPVLNDIIYLVIVSSIPGSDNLEKTHMSLLVFNLSSFLIEQTYD